MLSVTESDGRVTESDERVTESDGRVTERDGRVTDRVGRVTESGGRKIDSAVYVKASCARHTVGTTSMRISHVGENPAPHRS